MKHINIIATFCALLFVQTAFAANKIVYINGYELYDDYTAALISGAEATGEIELPNTITYEDKDYILTAIGEEAFYNNDNITSVVIPNSVSSIGAFAFMDCSKLESVTIGAFVQSIGKQAFDGCGNLKEVTFYPTTPPTMGNGLFSTSGIEIYGRYSYYSVLSDYTDMFASLQTHDYIEAVIDAIEIAANRAALSSEEALAIVNYEQEIKLDEDGQSTPKYEIAAHRLIAIAGIPRSGLTDDDLTVVDGKIADINNATSLAGIYTAQKEALEYIALLQEKLAVLAAIEETMQGLTYSAYLNNLVKEQVDAINSATDIATINSNKNTAISKLNAVVPTYKIALSELPTNGTTGNGVRIILGTRSLELMNPDKVEFIKK